MDRESELLNKNGEEMGKVYTQELLDEIDSLQQQVSELEQEADASYNEILRLDGYKDYYEEQILDLEVQLSKTGYEGAFGTPEQQEWAKEFVDEYNSYKY